MLSSPSISSMNAGVAPSAPQIQALADAIGEFFKRERLRYQMNVCIETAVMDDCIAGVPRHEEDLEVGSALDCPVGKLSAIDAFRHHNIG